MKADNVVGKIRKARWALGAAVLLCAFAAMAQGALEVTSAVFKEVEVPTEDGGTRIDVVPADRVVPGGEVIYEIAYRNTGGEVATDIAINNPLAKELVFVSAETEPTAVSVDGGATFGQIQSLTVVTDEGDVRPAQPTDITHLRWVVASLAPGASGSVKFRARVK